MVDKLKKPLVLLMLAVVLLSCMPELVQAADIVQKEDLTGESEHGEPLFDKDAARASTCSGSRIEFNSEYLGYNMYFTTPHNYCVVDFPSGKDYEQNHTQYILFIDTEGTPWDPYEVRDGEYARGYNQSLTLFSGSGPYEVEGQSATTSYYIHRTIFYTDHGKWNEETYPAPVHQPPVIHMPSRFEGISDEAIEYLLGCLTSGDMGDCRVTAGDSDNPDVNEPGGVPGSEDNPIYDEKIGTPILSGFRLDTPDVEGNLTGNNLEYYNVIKWKKKTSTGFNLNDSGYAVCRMQFKIEPKATFVELGKSTVLEPEVQTIDGRISLGFCNASQLEKKFQYHDLISKFYGKFLAEHHPATNAQSYELQTEFNYFCRVAVSDSLSVIPNQSDGWKCGKWKRLVVSGGYQETDSTSDSGEIDEDGNWVSDEDYEDVDDSVTHTDDPANADDDDVKDMDYGTDDVKGLVKQVGQFPKLIKKIFSFLPSWCLTLFAFGFACMIVLLVIKTIRG